MFGKFSVQVARGTPAILRIKTGIVTHSLPVHHSSVIPTSDAVWSRY
jgi:hypothetical protein